MRNLIVLFVLVFASSIGSTTVSAGDWIFRPSYYSHGPAPAAVAAQNPMAAPVDPLFPQPVPRSAYRPAHTQLGPGFAVRETYRYNVYRLWSGQSYDTTIFRQFSFQGSASR